MLFPCHDCCTIDFIEISLGVTRLHHVLLQDIYMMKYLRALTLKLDIDFRYT